MMKPIIQLSIDADDPDKAIEIVEDVQDYGVDWIEIGLALIKNYGLNTIKRFKEEFPLKKLIVNLGEEYTLDYINDVIDAGADIILISGISDIKSIESSIKKCKEKEVKIMTRIDYMSELEDKCKILEDAGVDYILIDILNDKIDNIKRIKKVSDSLGIPVAIGGNINSENIGDVIKSGANIIVINNDTGNSREVMMAIREITNDDVVTKDTMNVVNVIDEPAELETDEFLDIKLIEIDLEKIMKKFRELIKRREIEKKRLAEMEKRIEKFDEIKRECSILREELVKLERIRKKEKEEFDKEKKALMEDIKNIRYIREIEKAKIESERKKIKEEFNRLNDEWKRLREAEAEWDRKQKTREEEFRKRQEKIWEEWEKEQRKRWREYSLMREEERRKMDEEMQKIEQRWNEINRIVSRMDEEKEKISAERKKIRDEWKKIEEQIKILKEEQAKLKELEDKLKREKENAVEEMDKDMYKSVIYLPKLVSRVSDIYKEREQELRRLEKQRRLIDRKIKMINDKWKEIEKLERMEDKGKEMIERDRVKIKNKLSKIERDLLQLKKEHGVIKVNKKTDEKSFDEVGEKTLESLSKDDIKTKELIYSLISLVNKTESIELGDAAEILDVDESVVKRWSKLLEERDIITIDKKLFGKTILKEGANMHKYA